MPISIEGHPPQLRTRSLNAASPTATDGEHALDTGVTLDDGHLRHSARNGAAAARLFADRYTRSRDWGSLANAEREFARSQALAGDDEQLVTLPGLRPGHVRSIIAGLQTPTDLQPNSAAQRETIAAYRGKTSANAAIALRKGNRIPAPLERELLLTLRPLYSARQRAISRPLQEKTAAEVAFCLANGYGGLRENEQALVGTEILRRTQEPWTADNDAERDLAIMAVYRLRRSVPTSAAHAELMRAVGETSAALLKAHPADINDGYPMLGVQTGEALAHGAFPHEVRSVVVGALIHALPTIATTSPAHYARTAASLADAMRCGTADVVDRKVLRALAADERLKPADRERIRHDIQQLEFTNNPHIQAIIDGATDPKTLEAVHADAHAKAAALQQLPVDVLFDCQITAINTAATLRMGPVVHEAVGAWETFSHDCFNELAQRSARVN